MSIKKIGTLVIIINLILCTAIVTIVFFKYYTFKPVIINNWVMPLRHTLLPNYEEFKYEDNRLIHYKINSDGFRDREYSIIKPNNTFRIIILGDSYTFGLGVQLNETFPKQLETRLNKNTNKLNYEVLNFGVPSFNTQEEIKMLKEIGLKYKPDLVIVTFLHNDVYDNQFNKNTYYTLSKEYKNKKLKSKKAEELIWGEVDKRWNEKMKSMPIEELWKIVKDPLDELLTIARNNNFIVMIFSYQIEDLYDENLKDICFKNGWYYVKFKTDRDVNKKDLLLSNYHPNPLMNNIASENLFDAFVTYGFI